MAAPLLYTHTRACICLGLDHGARGVNSHPKVAAVQVLVNGKQPRKREHLTIDFVVFFFFRTGREIGVKELHWLK